MQSKIFIGIMTGNEVQNISEIVSNMNNIDGILAVDHYSTDGTYELLEANCKDGSLVQCPYQNHHAQSMNIWLNSPKLKIGDWVVMLDSCERIGPKLSEHIRSYVLHFEQSNINTIYNHSKLFMFKRWPHQSFTNTPHYGFHGGRQGYLSMQESDLFESEDQYYISKRNVNRDRNHFINHYTRYYLQLDSNHLLLGLEGKPNFSEIYTQREQQRMAFLMYLKESGIENTIKSLKEVLLFTSEVPEKLKWFINNNKILNDFYHYNINGKNDIVDNHNWEEIIKI